MKNFSDIFRDSDADKITDEMYSKICSKKELIEKFLIFIGFEDNELSGVCGDIKNKIFSLYKEKISILINKIEIFEHTLSNRPSVLIKEMVDRLSYVGACTDETEMYSELERVLCIEHCLYIYLIDEVIKYNILESESYKKIYKQFKYKGIKFRSYTGTNKDFEQLEAGLEIEPSELFRNVVSRHGREIKNSISTISYDEFYTYENDKVFFNFETIKDAIDSDNDDLWNILIKVEWYVDVIKRHYPLVISNGYNSSRISKILSSLLFWGLPIALALVALVLKFGLGR